MSPKSNKPPCVECKRHVSLIGQFCWQGDYCASKRVNSVTGKPVVHECWWYRRTPFCKFEQKEEGNE